MTDVAVIPDWVAEYKLCGCGCTEDEHDQITGRCRYCPEDQCDGFEYDSDGTALALSCMDDGDPIP